MSVKDLLNSAEIPFSISLITRYNIPANFKRNAGKIQINLDKTWLEARRRLFLNYCQPSVLMQTHKQFNWYVLFDQRTPEEYIYSLGGGFNPILCSRGPFGIEKIKDIIVAGKENSFITSRLDSDDIISIDYIETLATMAFALHYSPSVNRNTPYVLNFSKGIFFDPDIKKICLSNYPGNAFVSLYENRMAGPVKTVNAFNHTSIFKHFPYFRITNGVPMWAVVAHEGSGYEIRGAPLDGLSSELKARFPQLNVL